MRQRERERERCKQQSKPIIFFVEQVRQQELVMVFSSFRIKYISISNCNPNQTLRNQLRERRMFVYVCARVRKSERVECKKKR